MTVAENIILGAETSGAVNLGLERAGHSTKIERTAAGRRSARLEDLFRRRTAARRTAKALYRNAGTY